MRRALVEGRSPFLFPSSFAVNFLFLPALQNPSRLLNLHRYMLVEKPI
jgi:hypothetical protein